MGLTKKFRSKKTDQETQSPMIKVFKEMMHRNENANKSEKVNLLKTKHEKKRKRYSGSKSKTDDVRSDDTSAAERNYNVLQSQQEPKSFSKMKLIPTCMPQMPDEKEKAVNGTDSKVKCVWGSGTKVLTTSNEDTCSCMTCALKKLLDLQRNRVLCIAAILIISLIMSMYFILRPHPAKKCRDVTQTYEILARTLQPESGVGDKRDRRSQYDLDGKGMVERSVWDESKSRLLSGLSDLYSADFSDSNVHEGGSLHEGSLDAIGPSSLTDLSSILDPNKLSEGYSSNKLRNFYKKLIQTDNQIKNIKKSIRDIKSMNDYTDLTIPRSKRSLKVMTKPNASDIGRVERNEFREFNLFFPPVSAFKIPCPKGKVKRHFNFSSDPTGIVIEKQKLVLQYRPKAKVAKCSHTPKDSKTKIHESEHKHPFYKHSERLDDLLDRLMAKEAPEVIFEHLGVKPSTPATKCSAASNHTEIALLVKKIKQPHGNEYVLSTDNIFELENPKGSQQRHHSSETQNQQHTGKQQFDGALSVSTLIGNKNAEEKKVLDLQRMPGHRKLLQVDLEEDTWDIEPADQGKRTRRMGQLQPPKQTKAKHLTLDTHNPNWKDTMPLYPDELNAIIKQAAIQNFNKMAMPLNSDSAVTKDMSDTEYVEDYTNNKYNKLVKMAQAYSDYGVLDDKKEIRNEKNSKTSDNRVKMSASKGLGFFGRLKKSKTDKHNEEMELPLLFEKEGIRFEIKPNPRSDTGSTQNIGETFQLRKHLRLSSKTRHNPRVYQPSPTQMPLMKTFEFMTPSFKPSSTAKPKQTSISENGIFFFRPHKRSLKSVNVEDDIEHENDESTKIDNVNSTVLTLNTTHHADFSLSDEELKLKEAYYNTVTNDSYMGSKRKTEIEINTNKTDDLNITIIANNDKSSGNHLLLGIEEFFEMIADWFKSLTGLRSNENHTNVTGALLDPLRGEKPENIITPLLLSFSAINSTFRHRSRNLMSVEEKTDNVTSVNEQGSRNKEIEKNTEKNQATDIPAYATTTQVNEIANTSNAEQNTVTNEADNIDNKTIVKRSAPDTNLIFWNDIYDEEYGVKDPLEDTVRDKHSAKFNNDILSKSGNWIGVKLRKIADKVRKTARNSEKSNTTPVTARSKVNKRSDTGSADKQSFAALTANMKKVCREAAKAVHETKNTEVRSRSEAASTLMQQLVGLMSDLVEIQVQQKTCVQLPPDLQKFLLWLTSPNPEKHEPRVQNPVEVTTETYPTGGLPTDNFREIPSSPDLLPGSTDVRTECLGTIHDVQRLITLYDGMSEEDKSKMSGVREYLENQLNFLHKQLSSFEGYYDPSIFHRIRRRQTPKHKKLRRMKRKIHRFIKSFGKKRTRSTVNYDAFETFTDSYKNKAKVRNEMNAIKSNDKVKDESKAEMKRDTGNDNVKRNLPDVYYRALAEAKNATTVKSSTTKSSQS